jgi:uncharacterized membrane protein YphA (DoxX/SURF4 family)
MLNATASKLLGTGANVATPIVIVRIVVGWIFVSEGILKFVYPELLGAGRFAKLGIPAPEALAPFVGTVEIVCGTLILLGLATRLAAVPLMIVMVVALSTKIPILRDQGFGIFANMARVDFAMLLSNLFLLIVGAGSLSTDAMLLRGEALGTQSTERPLPAGRVAQ